MTLLVAWLGRVTGKIIPDKTYDVSSKTLNSTKPMPVTLLPFTSCDSESWFH